MPTLKPHIEPAEQYRIRSAGEQRHRLFRYGYDTGESVPVKSEFLCTQCLYAERRWQQRPVPPDRHWHEIDRCVPGVQPLGPDGAFPPRARNWLGWHFRW